jgi:glucose/arabinose dehydrogenase
LLPAALAIALAAWPAAAQQSTPTPPPPTPNQPTSDAAGKLRGINPPPFPMAADKLPVPQLKAPKGFKIDVFMSGIPNARSLRIGDKGTVFVSNRLLDKVYAVVEKNGKRELKTLGSAERSRLPQRHALHCRRDQDLEARKNRGQPRQSAQARRDLRPVSEPPVARLEIHGGGA